MQETWQRRAASATVFVDTTDSGLLHSLLGQGLQS
jgi:hypothetical protein